MSNKSFNFNILNYSIIDLQDIFELPPNFDANNIHIQETKLRKNILNNHSLSHNLKQDSIQFILDAKNKLLQSIHVPISPSPNPNSQRTFKYHLNVDTRFRDNFLESSSDFHINLPLKLNHVTKMELASIEFPTTFYLISNNFGNNFFSFKLTNTSDKSFTALFQLPNANYNLTTLQNNLNDPSLYSIVNNDFDSHDEPNYLDYLQNIDFSFDINSDGTGTGNCIFKMKNVLDIKSIQLVFNENLNCVPDNTDIFKKFGWLLGFRNPSYFSDFSFNSFQIVSESLLNLTGPKYIFMAIDDFNSNNNSSVTFYNAFNSNILQKNILARIPLSTYSFSFEIANTLTIVSTPREYFSPVNIDKLGIQLLDEFGRILDLNFMNISFCLSFTLTYDT